MGNKVNYLHALNVTNHACATRTRKLKNKAEYRKTKF